MSDGLRERLIGAWTLVSYQEIPVDGSESFEPLGPDPRGIIMYTPDGYMSAQLSRPDRPPFASGDWFVGTDEDYRREASTYIAYTGPFHVDEESGELTHTMFISLFPNWVGQSEPAARGRARRRRAAARHDGAHPVQRQDGQLRARVAPGHGQLTHPRDRARPGRRPSLVRVPRSAWAVRRAPGG